MTPPHPQFAGLITYLLALLMFAGVTAQANVNKPSKTGLRPANRIRRVAEGWAKSRRLNGVPGGFLTAGARVRA